MATGKNVRIAATTTFEAIPKPNQMITAGAMATIGMFNPMTR